MTDTLTKSVTRGDYADNPRSGAFHLIVPGGMYGPDAFGLPPEPPRYWSPHRDAVLRSTIFAEDMWASSVYKVITKNAALGWTLEDSEDSQRRIKQSQDIMLLANDGRGWVDFITQHLGDYTLSDKGAFVETVRASSARGSRVLAIYHLDGSRSMPTGDPEIPVIYRDLKGREHEMKWWQVLHFPDMPLGSISLHGIGLCAASRAYRTIYGLAGMEGYKTERITGNGANGIEVIGGITDKQLEDAIVTHSAEAVRRGARHYKGKILIPMINARDVNSISIDLAGMPDGFNAKEERENAYLKYANALGVPVQDIQPLTGQGLGTGTQTVILDEAAQGQGMAAWRKRWEHAVNEYILPTATTFSFSTNDTRDKKAKAEVKQLQTETLTALLESGIVTPDQARQMASDDELIPREFLAEDQTPGGTLSDSQKPIDPAQIRQYIAPATTPAQPAIPGLVTKADEWEGAVHDEWGPLPNFPAPGTDRAEGWRRFLLAGKAVDDTPLQRLIARLKAAITSLTDDLQAGSVDVDTWEDQVAQALSQAYPAAYKAGGGTLDDAARQTVGKQVKAQLNYLGRFALEIQGSDEWQAGWNSRAAMYAEGVKVPYWQGKTRMLSLPAMPGEGTTCLTRCRCLWDVQQLDGEGNYDAFWRRGASDSCQICIQRATEWAPLKVRSGRLV